MKNSVRLAAIGFAAAAIASGTALAQQTDSKQGKEMTFTGCLQANTNGTYVLTHVMRGKAGAKTASTSSSGSAPQFVALSSNLVPLAQENGHKVTVTGITKEKNASPSMNVESLLSLSGSCP
ncbi:MAG TPA: hypothetical protein VFY39_16545 [Gammaproteobacteria bacterium]|nr:hypothetical protein [Gammaproteobacteria bacterium]